MKSNWFCNHSIFRNKVSIFTWMKSTIFFFPAIEASEKMRNSVEAKLNDRRRVRLETYGCVNDIVSQNSSEMSELKQRREK